MRCGLKIILEVKHKPFKCNIRLQFLVFIVLVNINPFYID